jgi:hypothetical protein
VYFVTIIVTYFFRCLMPCCTVSLSLRKLRSCFFVVNCRLPCCLRFALIGRPIFDCFKIVAEASTVFLGALPYISITGSDENGNTFPYMDISLG